MYFSKSYFAFNIPDSMGLTYCGSTLCKPEGRPRFAEISAAMCNKIKLRPFRKWNLHVMPYQWRISDARSVLVELGYIFYCRREEMVLVNSNLTWGPGGFINAYSFNEETLTLGIFFLPSLHPAFRHRTYSKYLIHWLSAFTFTLKQPQILPDEITHRLLKRLTLPPKSSLSCAWVNSPLRRR